MSATARRIAPSGSFSSTTVSDPAERCASAPGPPAAPSKRFQSAPSSLSSSLSIKSQSMSKSHGHPGRWKEGPGQGNRGSKQRTHARGRGPSVNKYTRGIGGWGTINISHAGKPDTPNPYIWTTLDLRQVESWSAWSLRPSAHVSWVLALAVISADASIGQ